VGSSKIWILYGPLKLMPIGLITNHLLYIVFVKKL
jgi:hypothetical protein